MKLIKYILLSMIIVGLALYGFRTQILQGVALLLRVDNATVGADAIVILSGDPFKRVPKAAQLYRENYANKIIVIDKEKSKKPSVYEEMGYKIPDSSVLTIQLLKREAVREDDIIRISTDQATSTLEEAKMLTKFNKDHQFDRFILVTSAFHTSRARWIFRKIFKNSGIEIQVAAADPGAYSEKNWWKVEEGFLACFTEYLKWVYYLLNYGISTEIN